MADAISFQDLVRRVRAGDEEAARELVRRYEPAIRRAARFRLVDNRLARMFDSMDICQSVFGSFFLRVAAGQYDLDQPEQLLKLLVAMARNKVALQARAQRRGRRDYRRVHGDGVEQMQIAQAGPTPSLQVAGKELLEKAEQLLSPEERQLVALRQEGLPWDAIAEKIGDSPEALRKRLDRAMDRVARQLKLDTM